MKMRITSSAFMCAMALSGMAHASKHAVEIIRLNDGIALPHGAVTIFLDKLTPGKYYEISCLLKTSKASEHEHNKIYIQSATHYPYFKINDERLPENGEYQLPALKDSRLFAFTNENLKEITITNDDTNDRVNISKCYAINYIFGPRN